jgi:hypothetical protein
VQAIVRRAMEKDPARRYQSSGEMMQHCQQVFAELNHGGVSVGAGGMMKTAFAPGLQAMQPPPNQMMGPPMGQPPMMGGPPPQQAGFVPASPMQKTMIAQPSPFAGGVPQGGMPMQQPMQQPGPGGFVQSSPMQKTIVAGMAPPMVGGSGPQNPMMPPPGMQQGYPPQGPGMNPSAGPNKTVMLQPSDGVVSVARTGQALQPVGLTPGIAPSAPMGARVVKGATPLFWIICLLTGIAVGVLAYVIVLQTS